MALENSEVLQNLTVQLEQVTEQVNSLTNTRIRLLGAIEVLQQIENSRIEETEVSETDVVEEND
jgi:hypothetical protein|tara:strand:- start:797 stop:988 length:192 start_codon:yes stop_codon:yes gene_type:complete